MEYQGIITGIGEKAEDLPIINVATLPTENIDTHSIYCILTANLYQYYSYINNSWVEIARKENTSTNLITPDIDAVFRKFTFNRNGILEGLKITGVSTITKGYCILCGYIGKLENNLTLSIISNNFGVYGVFDINFSTQTVDSFQIALLSTTPENLNPTEITESGTYYLSLYNYVNGDFNSSSLPVETPFKTQISNIAETLLAYGEIQEGATGYQYQVNQHINYPQGVATLEYVHNQIEEEIAYLSQTFNIEATYSTNTEIVGYLVLKRKAKYVIGYLTIPTTIPFRFSLGTPIITIPLGLRPNQAFTCWIAYVNMQGRQGEDPAEYYHKAKVQFNTDGTVVFLSNEASFTSGLVIDKTCVLGYETI